MARSVHIFILMVSLLIGFGASPARAGDTVWLLNIKGAIGPATADYMIRGLERAAKNDASLVVLRIDTPGGLDKSMRQMIKAVLSSSIPVVGYVSPSGARAASAGTYLLYACHVAAMSPATNLGAATPVQIGAPGLPQLPKDPQQPKEPQSTNEQQPEKGEKAKQDKKRTPGTAMERKILNDAVAYIVGLAELRGRNAEWAEKAVRDAESLSASQALELGVIDLVAENLGALLAALRGRPVKLPQGSITLSANLSIETSDIHNYEPDWRNRFLSVITDPNVAYILMLIGIYGLIFEFSNPGMGVPGVAGAVCLLIALYAFQVLPVSYAGLGLIFLGITLMVAEAFAPSFGALGLGGIIAFIVGSIILMDTELPAFQIALPIVLAVAAASAGLLVLLLGLMLKARQQAVVTGLHTLIGLRAPVTQPHGNRAVIRLQGELWQVESELPLTEGDWVRVDTADGLILSVASCPPEET